MACHFQFLGITVGGLDVHYHLQEQLTTAAWLVPTASSYMVVSTCLAAITRLSTNGAST
jgi:hypothetical protein